MYRTRLEPLRRGRAEFHHQTKKSVKPCWAKSNTDANSWKCWTKLGASFVALAFSQGETYRSVVLEFHFFNQADYQYSDAYAVAAKLMLQWSLIFTATFSTGFIQGRISHWGNRANALGLTLEYQNTPLLVFHVFRLFTTRQNCRAFWLLRLVYR